VDNQCGWLVPAGDSAAMAGALRTAVSASSAQIAAMGEAGRAKVIRDHNSSGEALKLVQLFAASSAQ
jgi:colanic acid/amylovoran biosynthesis glycosyltransferase